MRVVTLFLILSFVPVSHFAQSYVGFKAGLFTTHINNSDNDANGSATVNNNLTPGFAFILNTQISKLTLLGANLQYDLYDVDYSSRYSSKGDGRTYTTEGHYTYSYVSLYIYPQFNFGNKFQFYFNLGPSLKFLATSYAEGYYKVSAGKPGDTTNYGTFDGAERDKFAPIMFSFTGTLGFQYNVSNKWYVFTDVNMINWVYPFDNSDLGYLMDIKINLGFMFRFSDKRLEANPQNKQSTQ